MRKMWYLSVLVVALGAMLSLNAFAAKVGDKAPELQIQEWVKGTPVTLKQLQEEKKVAVIEFWATWCPPCRESIPHLTELQKKYEGKVVFIGVSSEDTKKVVPFVESQGDKMAYRVAVDKAGNTTAGFMDAFGVQGIPHAFIVDLEGRIMFLAHPSDPAFEDALQQVVEGTFTLAKAQGILEEQRKTEELLQKAEELFQEYTSAVSEGQDKKVVSELSGKVYGLLKDNADLLGKVAWVVSTQLEPADLDFGLKCAERAVELTDKKDPDLLDTLARVLFERGEKEKAIELEKQALTLTEDEELKKHIEEQLQIFSGVEVPAEDEDEGEDAAPAAPAQ